MNPSRLSLLLACGLLIIGSNATAEVIDSAASGMTLRNSITVPVDVATAWTGLVEHVNEWWPKNHSWFGDAGRFTIEATANGCFCEIAGERQARHMVIAMVDPGRLLRMLGGLGPLQGMGMDGALEWRFEAAGDSTQITLNYVAGGYTTADLTELAPVVDSVQLEQLESLGAFLRAQAQGKGE